MLMSAEGGSRIFCPAINVSRNETASRLKRPPLCEEPGGSRRRPKGRRTERQLGTRTASALTDKGVSSDNRGFLGKVVYQWISVCVGVRRL